MRKSRFSEEQIIRVLGQVEAGQREGERWWSLPDFSSVAEAFSEMQSLLGFAWAELDGLSTLDALVATLKAGTGRGLTVVEQASVAARLRSAHP